MERLLYYHARTLRIPGSTVLVVNTTIKVILSHVAEPDNSRKAWLDSTLFKENRVAEVSVLFNVVITDSYET